jgi:hypothetical protein
MKLVTLLVLPHSHADLIDNNFGGDLKPLHQLKRLPCPCQ